MPIPKVPAAIARLTWLGGQLSEAALPLVRNIIMAHLLLPEQFGLAVSLSVVSAAIEQCSDLGFDRSIVRRVPGQEEVRRATLHSLNVLRGLLLGLLAAALGPFIARWVEAPEAAWAFSALGLASVIRGFTNLGIKEATRDYVYWVDAATILLQQAVWTVAIAAVYFLLFDDWRCMLVALIGGQVAYVATSHLLSADRWRLGFDRETVLEVLRYGAPLVPNGMALSARAMGDRLAVATFLGLEIMAFYSISVISALMPRAIIQRVMTTVFLSYFINAGLSGARDSRLFDVYAMVLSVLTTAYALSFLLLGAPGIALVFGEQYRPGPVFVDLVTVTIVVKMMLCLSVVPALAYGHTVLILIGSVGGLAAFGIATGVVIVTRDLVAMMAGIAAAEALVLPVSLYFVSSRLKIPPRGYAVALAVPVLVVAAAMAVLHAEPPSGLGVRVVLLGSALVGAFGIYTLCLSRLGLSWRRVIAVLLRRDPSFLAAGNAAAAAAAATAAPVADTATPT